MVCKTSTLVISVSVPVRAEGGGLTHVLIVVDFVVASDVRVVGVCCWGAGETNLHSFLQSVE